MKVIHEGPPPSVRKLLLAALAAVLVACSGGESKPILKPMVRADFEPKTPPQADPGIFFANPSAVGDALTLDVVVQDTSGSLDIDDIELVIRYDATFIQVVSVTGQNQLFGTCGTVNPECGVNSPICIENRAQANGGGERFCRSDGSTPCATDTDCTAVTGDACGSFGVLRASFTVLTGSASKICSNNTARSCTLDSDCQLCSNNLNRTCLSGSDCRFCLDDPNQACTSPADCTGGVIPCDAGTCTAGTCRNKFCPSVVVSGTKSIATLTLRVMKKGASDFRFVTSTISTTGVSAARKDLVAQSVSFIPNVDVADPSNKSVENFLIIGDL